MTHLTANGIRMRYRLEGESGPWLVFSNSLGCSLEMWDAQAEVLKGRYRLLRYDTRGHGGTQATRGAYDFDLLADDLLALMNEIGVEKAVLVGLSMGGMLAQVAALKAPERFAGLVLCDTTSRYGPEVADFWANRVRLALTEGLAGIAETTPSRWFTPGYGERHPEIVAHYQAMLRATDPLGYAGCCGAIPRIDVTDRLDELPMPARVIVGAQDPSTTPDHARRIVAAYTGADLVVLEDAAHLSNVEQPEAFTAAVEEFLERVGNW
ncbi:3-oxoadipate enol-lactonase [Acetobacteraceae bacterium H6797]|nr:3-oxoadipate enol-lactonase [Acetobacteraceae bacterium H6797]